MEINEKGIGTEGFEKIFKLKEELKEEIENYKNKKTMIHLKFIKFSMDKKKYNKLKFPSLNKVISIEETNSFDFEYINNKFAYKNEFSEKIILLSEENEKEFLINIKRRHDNYYIFCIDIENDNEKTYSLEIVFFFKESEYRIENIEVSNIKIEANEKFPKTIRYNLVNINLNDSIKLFDDYSSNKINQLDENQRKELFKECNLFFNFIYGNKKRIGKIFYMKQEKEIEDFIEEEKSILNKIHEMIPDENINEYDIIERLSDFKNSYNYDIIDKYSNKKVIRNHLIDLNEKFDNMPIFLKYYDKNPTIEDIRIIRDLSILNILLI